MNEPILQQHDIKLMLKASIDYNSFILGIVSQVVNNDVKVEKVIREIKRGQKNYQKTLDYILEKYTEPPEPKIDPNLHSTYP